MDRKTFIELAKKAYDNLGIGNEEISPSSLMAELEGEIYNTCKVYRGSDDLMDIKNCRSFDWLTKVN